MSQIAQENSLFDIDQELDFLLDEMQEASETDDGDVHADLLQRFQEFCDAHVEKVDRIGRFLSVMEWRAQFCRVEATRLYERARAADNKIEKTKGMVLYYLRSRELRKIEGKEFTLRAQKNSQDSVSHRASVLPARRETHKPVAIQPEPRENRRPHIQPGFFRPQLHPKELLDRRRIR